MKAMKSMVQSKLCLKHNEIASSTSLPDPRNAETWKTIKQGASAAFTGTDSTEYTKLTFIFERPNKRRAKSGLRLLPRLSNEESVLV